MLRVAAGLRGARQPRGVGGGAGADQRSARQCLQDIQHGNLHPRIATAAGRHRCPGRAQSRLARDAFERQTRKRVPALPDQHFRGWRYGSPARHGRAAGLRVAARAGAAMNTGTAPQWLVNLRASRGAPAAAARTAPDAVNLPMIRRWCEAMGESNPLYLDDSYAATSEYGGVVAPPAMLEVWTMGRFRADGSTDTGQLLGMEQLNTAGFTAVVATNLEQEYLRYLRPGDLITQRVFLEDVSDEKRTALGAGHFLD